MKSQKKTFIDLFAGCGGFSLGFIQGGYQCLWANEIDESAVLTYKQNIGHHIICDDIKNICTATIPKIDVLIGGFPCQPFSVSGLQHGFSGKDGDLFYQCVRFINDCRPKVFLLENVAGFASLKNGFFLETALKTLRSLGYLVSWKIINAADYGVPQTRRRIYIMGNNLTPREVPACKGGGESSIRRLPG